MAGSVVVLLTGPPGTGKSTLADAAARSLGAPVLGWDWAMAALTPFAPVQASLAALDRSTHRAVGWSILANLATAQLRRGQSVVIDGVARDEEVALVASLAAAHDAAFRLVVTECSDPARHRAAIEGRDRAIPGWHELTWDSVATFLAEWRAPRGGGHAVLTLDAQDDLDANVARLLAFVDPVEERAGFAAGEDAWVARLGNLRNAVRQEVIGRQVGEHARRGWAVLDVGCGQGTQAVRLAARGCRVTGIDASEELLARCAASARAAGVEVDLVHGRFEQLDDLLADRRFDLVCAHGLLMYLPDRSAAIASLAVRLADGGTLSFTVRNGDALAYRPGLRGDWQGALDAFDTDRYVNELGVTARADRLADVVADLDRAGLALVDWYGVRVLTDHVAGDVAPPPDPTELAALLDAEDQAGRRDPYRGLASQLHLVARRP